MQSQRLMGYSHLQIQKAGTVTAAVHCHRDLVLELCTPHRAPQIQKEPNYNIQGKGRKAQLYDTL